MGAFVDGTETLLGAKHVDLSEGAVNAETGMLDTKATMLRWGGVRIRKLDEEDAMDGWGK